MTPATKDKIMKEYRIVECKHGYVIQEKPEERYMASDRIWAFSTLKEVQDYLPKLFEKQELNNE